MQDLAPVLEPLLAALFTAFSKPDSAENEYVMRCVMRVISFVGPEVTANHAVYGACCVPAAHEASHLPSVSMYALHAYAVQKLHSLLLVIHNALIGS